MDRWGQSPFENLSSTPLAPSPGSYMSIIRPRVSSGQGGTTHPVTHICHPLFPIPYQRGSQRSPVQGLYSNDINGYVNPGHKSCLSTECHWFTCCTQAGKLCWRGRGNRPPCARHHCPLVPRWLNCGPSLSSSCGPSAVASQKQPWPLSQ